MDTTDFPVASENEIVEVITNKANNDSSGATPVESEVSSNGNTETVEITAGKGVNESNEMTLATFDPLYSLTITEPSNSESYGGREMEEDEPDAREAVGEGDEQENVDKGNQEIT